MPILIFLSFLSGQTVVVTVVPMQAPRIEFKDPAPQQQSEATAGCHRVVCAV